jgi:hypothetical protein
LSADANKSRPWQRWAFAAVPAAGLLELGAHVVQTHAVPSASDWKAAREYVAAEAKPEDLVAFAPKWVDPIGRETFGDSIATVDREARADESRFPRALEVSVRGGHVEGLAGWTRGDEKRFGGVTVTTWVNPSPAHVLYDLVSNVNPMNLRVSRGDQECGYVHGGAQSGNLGFGPAVPGDRFNCNSGGFVGVSVVADLDYVPHRCIYAPPASGAPLRMRFLNVTFGRTLHGHHAIYVEAERMRRGAPVTIAFKVGDASIGSVLHTDGDGWKPFEFDTSDLAGKQAELVVEVSAPNPDRRMYCFEADTR